jgi:hypothetical protein
MPLLRRVLIDASGRLGQINEPANGTAGNLGPLHLLAIPWLLLAPRRTRGHLAAGPEGARWHDSCCAFSRRPARSRDVDSPPDSSRVIHRTTGVSRRLTTGLSKWQISGAETLDHSLLAAEE